MNTRNKTGRMVLVSAAWAATVSGAWAQGSLTPPGAPDATMRTLEQVEPRTPIGSAPYTISQPGSYYLTTNLASTGHGVVITTGGVTLDLMGFTIGGDRGAADYGVFLDGATNASLKGVVVRNGVVRDFGHGVRAEFVEGGRFERLSVGNNSLYGVVLFAQGSRCNGNVVADCSVCGNLDIAVLFSGFSGSCDHNSITRCAIHGNGGVGIQLEGQSGHCDGNTIAGCTISSNGSHGVYLNGMSGQSDGNRIAGCSVFGNGGAGLYLSGYYGQCQGNTVADCAVGGNRGYGVHLHGEGGRCDGNAVTRCAISGSGDIGVALDGHSGRCEGNSISGCTILMNRARGMYLYSADGNRVEGNHVSDQAGTTTYGIYCTNTAMNLILLNTCVGQTTNFTLTANDTYGPVVTNAGALGTTGASAHPWANFSR